ncbi:outer membrane beta-barrel protein [Dokdonia sp.]|uniref:outer membrane beta-barrel protein n=1 Tax=Dokdonia sp. TaxID=2024995 RepID=UPI0032651A73
MKSLKSILILSLLLYSFVGFSQTEEEEPIPTAKGNFVIGGSSSFNFSSSTPKTKSDSGDFPDTETRNTSFSFMPNFGYFVIDNLAIGGGISFTSNKTKSDAFDFESTNTAFVFSPFVRYYFTEGNVKPFLQGTVGAGFSNTKVDDDFGEDEFKNSVFNYGFEGGVAFFLGNSASIDLGVGYRSSSVKPRDDNDNNVRFVTNGFGFNAGFNIFF